MKREEAIIIIVIIVALSAIGALTFIMKPQVEVEMRCRQEFCDEICVSLGYDSSSELGNKCVCDKELDRLFTNVSLTYSNIDFSRCYPE